MIFALIFGFKIMLLLFDIDGVLNQSDYFTIQYQQDFGVGVDLFDPFFRVELPDLLRGKVKIEDVLPRYFETWNWKGTTEEFLNYWFQNDVKICLELIAKIDELKSNNIKLGIASQQEFRRKDYLLNKTILKDKFDHNYFSCDLGFLKNEPEFYKKIINENQGEVYFWDDSIENFNLANQQGIKAFHYTTIKEFKIQLEEILKKD